MSADPTPVFETAMAFWRSGALFAACELKVFDGLAGGPFSAADLAERLGTSARGMQALLDACVALRLVERKGPAYLNTQAAEQYLTSASPDSLLVALGMQAGTWSMWGELPKAVREGKPVVPPSGMLGGDPEITRRFTLGMHQRARAMARCIMDVVDFGGRSLVADIGGGPGSLSIALAERHPGLRARVMDLGPVLEIAKELIAGSRVSDRVATHPCDVTTDEVGSGFDAALVSGILHRLSPEQCRSLLQKVFDGLDPGGLVAVNDLFRADAPPTGSSPEAVLFGLQMLLTTGLGETHAVADVAGWLREVGFVDVATKPLPRPHPHTLVIGEKP